MNCLKCGREVSSGKVFCDNCLKDMQKYPVPPDIVVQLPKRENHATVRRTPKKKTVPLEEQIVDLKSRVRKLTYLLLAACILVLLLAYPAAQFFMDKRVLPGQNYKTVTSVTSPPESLVISK